MKIFGKFFKESVIITESVLNTNDNCMTVNIFTGQYLEATTSIGFILYFWIMLTIYIKITEIVGEKRIDLAYLIWGKKVAIISMFNDNFHY